MSCTEEKSAWPLKTKPPPMALKHIKMKCRYLDCVQPIRVVINTKQKLTLSLGCD